MSGDTYNTSMGGFDYSLLKLSSSGGLIWTKDYIKTGDDRTNGVTVNNYGYKGYVEYGHISPSEGFFPPARMYLIETDRTTGEVINATETQRTSAEQVIAEPADFFYSAGRSADSISGDENMALIRVNKNLYTCGSITLSPAAKDGIVPYRIKTVNKNYKVKDSSVVVKIKDRFRMVERCSESAAVSKAGITEPNLLTTVFVYPSPVANSNIVAKINSTAQVSSTVSVTDANGTPLLKRKVNLMKGNNTMGLDVSKFHNGTYVLSVSTDRERKQVIFIKIN